MTNCPTKKIDSNIVGLSIAEESCIGVLPDDVADSGDQAGGVWYPLEPNEYNDFGAEIETTARTPINSSRQVQKGVVTDLNASGGFSQDVTPKNLNRLTQGFMFADAICRTSTKPINGKAESTVVVVDIEAGSAINVDDGTKFAVGQLIRLSGFAESENNVVTKIATIVANKLTVTATTLVVEAYTVGTLEVVGFEHADGDLTITFADNAVELGSTAGFTDMDYQVGEWIFVGGKEDLNRFSEVSGTNKPGYARIQKVEDNTLTLKEPTWVPLTSTGTGKQVRIFAGDYIRNQKDPSLIKRRTYQIERTLGTDDDGTQSEVLIGAVANELDLKFDNSDKLMCDLSFMALDDELRTGDDGLKPGDRTAKLDGLDAFNTSSNVYQHRLYVYGDEPTPVSNFAFISESNLSINNGASGLKAIGTLGSFEVSVGDFSVSGSLEVYFSSIASVQAVRNNSDVGYNTILALDNMGAVYDIPLLSLGDGRVNVEKDESIMLPLEKQAAENDNGYTMSVTYFGYLPDVAMA